MWEIQYKQAKTIYKLSALTPTIASHKKQRMFYFINIKDSSPYFTYSILTTSDDSYVIQEGVFIKLKPSKRENLSVQMIEMFLKKIRGY